MLLQPFFIADQGNHPASLGATDFRQNHRYLEIQTTKRSLDYSVEAFGDVPNPQFMDRLSKCSRIEASWTISAPIIKAGHLTEPLTPTVSNMNALAMRD